MFEDIDDRKSDQKTAIDISRDAGDRGLVYVIWTRNAGNTVPIGDAWGILHDRYPEDARFLLLNAYEEIVGARESAWSPGEFLGKVRRVLDTAGGRLNPEVRDLLAVAEDDLHPLSEGDAAHLDRIRARVSSRVGSADASPARKRLQRFAADLVRELHDRTAGGKPIGRTSGSMPAAGISGSRDWKSAVADAKGARTTYAATAKVTAGDVVEHPKFGAGVVLSVEPGRANILFETGARKLVVG